MAHKAGNEISLNKLRSLIEGKQLYIWGAGNQGRGIAQVLRANNISPVGYIDSSPDMFGKVLSGLTVSSPKIISQKQVVPFFIIISSYFYEKEIGAICTFHGLLQDKDFVHYSTLKPRDYSIDVSGSCNLQCISCPRSSREEKKPSAGMLSLETFQQVVGKIKKEDPFVGNIQLYQWGEPTLNKKLPDIISYALQEGIYSAISSNLNHHADYQGIIEARPEWFRVSASGWGDDYEITHTGGNWETFLRNFKKVAQLRRDIHPEMKLELYYHLYKHSTGEELRKFRDLCEELSVELHPVYAYLISLDDVLRYMEGIPLPVSAEAAQQKMLLSLNVGLEIAKGEVSLPCDAFRSIHINSDISVSNCMMYFYPKENRAVTNYLEHSIEEIMAIRGKCSLCRRCMKQGMHRYCGSYATFKPDFDELAKDVR